MSFEKAKEHLKKYKLDKNIKVFDESSSTVSAAAIAVGCSEREICKTLSFLIDNEAILILVAGDSRIDNHKFKDKFKTKAKMISFEDVEKYIGHAPGGVCPFGINDGVKVYLDISLKQMDVVYPACGSGNSAVKLTIKELEEASNYLEWVDVCK